MYDPGLSTEKITLSFKRYAAQIAVFEDFLDSADVRIAQDHAFGQLIYQLRTKILADDLPPEQFTAQTRVAFEVPASTWQMWKKRNAARWYARRIVARWPVRYEPDPDGRGTTAICTASLERWRAYPRAKVRLPDHFGGPVLFHAVRDLRWDYDPAGEEGRQP
ncbi:MAG TPA: hypothetical protein VK599_05290 [Streptosporangiaceae bacterium]|nr:hypothetical protein [Streptosporangiaceae bacterium]